MRHRNLRSPVLRHFFVIMAAAQDGDRLSHAVARSILIAYLSAHETSDPDPS
ncbi:hypothetical protein ACTYEO_12400 [Rhodophyticola sp. SM2404]